MQLCFVYSSEQMEELTSFFGLYYFPVIVFVMKLVLYVIIDKLTDAENFGYNICQCVSY